MDIKYLLRRMRLPRELFYTLKWHRTKAALPADVRRKSEELLRSYQRRFAGERCFIIGNGPSLCVEDLDALQGEYTFASNRIFTLYNRTDWRPTFFAAQDEEVIRSIRPQLQEAVRQSEAAFLPMAMYGSCREALAAEDQVVWMPLRFVPPRRNRYRFATDLSKEVIEGLTITYSCMQLAAYMGFQEIYLLGVDHSYGVAVDNDGRVISQDTSTADHFADAGQVAIENRNLPKIVEMTRAYNSAEQFSKEGGFRIYNATRGGKLEVFQRVSLDSLVSGGSRGSHGKA